MKKTIQALLAALVVLLFGSAAAGSPVATTPIIVVAPADVKSVSRPTLSHQEENPPAIIGASDSGGTETTFRSDKEEPGTTQPVYSGLHVIFGGTEAIRQGGGAPVVTAAKGSAFAVEMKPSQVGAEHHDTKFDADSETMNTQTLDVAARDPAYA